MINRAEWIGGNNLLRKTFYLKNIEKAVLQITGLGYYVCYINGKRVGDIRAAPSYTYYKKRVEFNEFDVTDLLRKGENVLAVMLGAHWENGYRAEDLKYKPYYTGENMLRCALVCGETCVLSDTDFKVHSSPVTESGIYYGETYHAALEPLGWKEIGYNDAAWQNAVKKENGARLTKSYLPPVRITQKIAPVKKWKVENGYVYDFGVNISGVLTIEGEFPAGCTVTMRHAENIFPRTHKLNTGSLRIARATDCFIAKGGKEIYTPFFTYHGFRYAEVSCRDFETLKHIRVTANVVHTDVKSIFEFECDNRQLNEIVAMMRRTFLNNMYSVPTDCHQRDERQGWLGDAQLSCESELYAFDAADFYRKYLDDVADAVTEDGNVFYYTAPPAFSGEGLMWSGAYYMIADALYRLFGDLQTLKKHFGKLSGYYKWLESREENGFPQIGGLGDWLGIAHTDEGQIRDAVYIDFTQKMADFSSALGKTEDEKIYRAKIGTLKRLYNERYYSPHESTQRNSGYYGACADISQLGNALPLCFDIAEEKDVARITQKLIYDLTEARGGLQLTTGLIGTKYLFDALQKTGNDAVALDLLLKKNYPSWGFMLKKGATTVWERWEYMTDNEMNSHCHTPLAAPFKWIVTRLAGLTFPKTENGEVVFSVNPYCSEKLKYVKASLATAYGTIRIEWEKKESGFRLTAQAPQNCKIFFNGKLYADGKLQICSL